MRLIGVRKCYSKYMGLIKVRNSYSKYIVLYQARNWCRSKWYYIRLDTGVEVNWINGV